MFSDHSTIADEMMKLIASTMLSAAIKWQYSLVVLLLHHSLPVFTHDGIHAIVCTGCPNKK